MLSQDAKFYLKNAKFCNWCQILRLKCTKFNFGCCSAPDPTGELTALPRQLAGFRALLLREKEEKEGRWAGMDDPRFWAGYGPVTDFLEFVYCSVITIRKVCVVNDVCLALSCSFTSAGMQQVLTYIVQFFVLPRQFCMLQKWTRKSMPILPKFRPSPRRTMLFGTTNHNTIPCPYSRRW